MLNKTELGLIALVRGALTQQILPLPEGFSAIQVLPIIKRHQIAPMLIHTLSQYESADAALCVQKLMQTSGLSLSVTESQLLETEAICAAFEAERIDYALLKGSLLRTYYPENCIRTMADVDILVRMSQYDRIAPIMERLGFERGVESDHEYNWKKGRVHMELHKSLIPTYDKSFYKYFGDGWGIVHPAQPGSTRHVMTDEDQFVYLFTHYAKHFRDGGIGIKHLTDLRIFKNAKPNLQEKRIVAELKKLELDEFYRNVMHTAAVWFDGAQADELTELMTREIISNGAYGRETTRKKAEVVRNTPTAGKNSKFRWTLRMIFLPYKNMCTKYPFLKKLPFLLPIMWVVRWITALFCKTEDTKKNVNLVRNMSQESVDDYREYLASLGLHFDAKE